MWTIASYIFRAKSISYETWSSVSHTTLTCSTSTRDASHMHKTGGGGTRTTKTTSWKNHTLKLLTSLMPRFCNVRIPTRCLKASPPQMAAKYLTANYTWDYEITWKEVLVIHSKQPAQTKATDQKPWPVIRYARQIQTIRLKFILTHPLQLYNKLLITVSKLKSAHSDPNKRMQSEWRTRTYRNSRNKKR